MANFMGGFLFGVLVMFIMWVMTTSWYLKTQNGHFSLFSILEKHGIYEDFTNDFYAWIKNRKGERQ